MISKFIKLVNNQIDYFDYMLNKNPKKSSVQAKFWPLKYEFEQLLEYLKSQNEEKSQKLTLSGTIAPHNEKVCFQEKTDTAPPNLRPKTRELEENILKIIKDYPQGIHTLDIKDQLQKRFETKINDSTLANRMYNIYRNRNIVEKIKRGIYKYKEGKYD